MIWICNHKLNCNFSFNILSFQTNVLFWEVPFCRVNWLSYNKDSELRSRLAYISSRIVNNGSYERYLTAYKHTMWPFLILLFFLSLWLNSFLSRLGTTIFHPFIPFEQKRILFKRNIFRHLKKYFVHVSTF